MAEKLIAPVLNTGVTNPKFVLIRLSDGAYWNTSGTPAFEAYNASNIASYGIAGTQTGSTGIYTVTNPSPTTPAEFVFVSAAGSSMAVSDVAANILWQDFCGPRNSNVEYFGGSAGTFSSGRPEVNTTLIEGVDATNQLASAAGGAGTGARTITITVDDGSDEIEGAIVRLTNGVQTYTDTTNSSGIATLNVDDATWTVAITKLGYSFAGTSLVVNGDETQAYSMTAVVISPAAPGQTTGYLTTRDGGGTAKGGVTVAFKLIEGPGTDGNSYDAGEFEATSDGAGLLEVTLVQSAKYIATRGDIEVEFTTGTDSTYELPEQLGIDAD